MCGIAAIVTQSNQFIASQLLQQMTSRLAHRGPDGIGYAVIDPSSGRVHKWEDGIPNVSLCGVLLGHRRLNILDLTVNGHQPMFNNDQSLAIIYNGEIYNYVELRNELSEAGFTFKSHTDTEVVLSAYEYWGNKAFEKFNGMWALIIWDKRNKKVLVSRDRFGVKPLYYTQVNGTWLFASEIKALLAWPDAFRGFSGENVRQFIDGNHIDCNEETILNNIFSLSPGVYAELKDDRLLQKRYWSVNLDKRFTELSVQELSNQYGELLKDAVKLRMRSDVPVGTMLSGGLDSTSIAALINDCKNELDKNSNNSESLRIQDFQHTITSCWPGWINNEEDEASRLCSRYGFHNHKVFPTAITMSDALDTVISHLDEPFENPTAIIQFLLMNKARKLGLKVVLNGHGSDEVLAGYPATAIAPFLASLLAKGSVKKFIQHSIKLKSVGEWSMKNVARNYWHYHKSLQNFKHTGDDREFVRGVSHDKVSTSTHWHQRPDTVSFSGIPSALTVASWRAFSSQILPKWLRMEDRISMACSIESRLPFMDYRLVEFGLNLPDEAKLHNGCTKYILRSAMKNRLPKSITYKRKKTRFSSPFTSWVDKEWRSVFQDNLLGSTSLQEHMDVSELQTNVKNLGKNKSHNISAYYLWRALCTELCLRKLSETATQNLN